MVSTAAKKWSASEEVRNIIAETPELRRLYLALGYSAETEKKLETILSAIKSLLKIEINSPRFREYVTQVKDKINKCERGEFDMPNTVTDPVSRKLWQQMAHPLWSNFKGEGDWKNEFWKRAQAASKNISKLDNVKASLQIIYDEEWRGYMMTARDQLPLNEDSFVEIRVADTDAFIELLGEIEESFGTRSALRFYDEVPEAANTAYSEIMATVTQLRTDLQNSNIWQSLCTLKRKIESVMSLEYDDINCVKKNAIDDVLWDLVYDRHEFDTDRYSFRRCDYYKEQAAKHAHTLIETPWMQNRWLIKSLLLNLLETDLVALNGIATYGLHPNRWTSNLPYPFGQIVPSLLSFILFLASLFLIFMLFELGMTWLAYLGIGYLLWHYCWRFFRNYQVAANRGKVLQTAARLEAISIEVKTNNFQREEISRRLRQLEEAGLYVHSLVYPLLNLQTA